VPIRIDAIGELCRSLREQHREVFGEEREVMRLHSRIELERPMMEERRVVIARRAGDRVERRLAVGEAGKDRRGEHACVESRTAQAAHRFEPRCRRRRLGLDLAREVGVDRADRETDSDRDLTSDADEHIDVADDERALRDDDERQR